MRRLIVMRHAKTERLAGSGEDFDRALTSEGHHDAGDTARALAAAGLVADLALVSAAVRARETFEAMGPLLPDMGLETRQDLYHATPAALLHAAETAEGDTVLLVGHNPSVHALALALIDRCVATDVQARTRIERGFPTATAAAFEWAEDRIGCLGVFGPRI